MVEINTDFLTLQYLSTSTTSFNSTNIQVNVRFNGQNVTWSAAHYADQVGNLFGTIRTLDGVDGSINLDCINQPRSDLHCTYGVASRAGYVVYDDTHMPAFNVSGNWPWLANHTYNVPSPSGPTCAVPDAARRDCGWPGITDQQCQMRGCCLNYNGASDGTPVCYYSNDADQDLYLFGYGHDYKAAMNALTQVSGSIPIPPRYAFGVFYSRYWAYSDIGQMQLTREYEQRNIPLDVLVTDMDWHITFYKEANQGVKDQAGQTIGWTGFTWDPNLFPNPTGFLDWCKRRGLRNTLNLHPASGMQPWEEKYSQMAVAMGIDPATHRYVPFDITDPVFTTNWLEIVMKPLADQGIDFWWLDWQQGENWINLPSVNPTFWLNYVFFTDPYHWGTGERPMLLHRWGGLGNHRYQVGFSGDVVPSWDSLAFQPYFTATAANVGYGYWSHDLGGHTQPSPPELYTRWVQWGAFSPIFRTHCTKNAQNDRRIWMYPELNYHIMRAAMQLRAQLLPYIYTAARRTFETGLALLTPLYYEYPEADEAYAFQTQYMFGDRMMVAPVVVPMTASVQLSDVTVWLPPPLPGSSAWFDWFRGILYRDGQARQMANRYTLDEIPVFVTAGTVIPMKPSDTPPLGQAQVIPTSLTLVAVPGIAAGSSVQSILYEDDGLSSDYAAKAMFAQTVLSFGRPDKQHMALIVQPPSGTYKGMPLSRSYQVRFVSVWPANTVTVNGVAVPYDPSERPTQNSWRYDGDKLTLIVEIVSQLPVHTGTTVTIDQIGDPDDPLLTSGFPLAVRRFVAAKQLLDDQWGIDTVYQEDYESLIDASECGQRISFTPATAVAELNNFATTALNGVQQLKSLSSLSADVKQQLVEQLSDALSVMVNALEM